jgi:hypothetical protein
MHENAARALQYYEDLPRRSGRPGLRLVDGEPRRRRDRDEPHDHPRGDAAGTAAAEAVEAAEIRTITLEPEPRPARRRGEAPARRPAFPPRQRQAVAPRIAGRPDRVAMWAVLLGFFLTAVAAATGHG